MKKKYLAENIDEFIAEGLELSPSAGMWNRGEIKTNTEDFVYNEVVLWLMEQMKNAGPKFTYEQGDYFLSFYNTENLRLSCQKEHNKFNGGWHVEFMINRDKIFEYNINAGSFTQPEAFVRVFQNGEYKKYILTSGVEVKPKQYKSMSFKDFKDLKLRKQLWQKHIKTRDYLKNGRAEIKWVTLGYGDDKSTLSYKQVIDLPKTIINEFKKSILFKSYIKGESIEKLNKKLIGRAAKGGLTLDNAVNFLEATKVTHKTTQHDNTGPWATTGTSEGIDEFDIAKLQKLYPDTNKFLMDNAEEIFKGLQKKKYAHSLGYYKFIQAGIKGNLFQMKISCTTYHN